MEASSQVVVFETEVKSPQVAMCSMTILSHDPTQSSPSKDPRLGA